MCIFQKYMGLGHMVDFIYQCGEGKTRCSNVWAITFLYICKGKGGNGQTDHA